MRGSCLTRKQLWRKCATKSNVHKKEENNYITKKILSNYNLLTKYIVNDEDYYTETEKFSVKKVKFNSYVKVVLIPEIYEYKMSRIHEKLWYSYDDFIGFRSDYEEEIENKRKYNTI